MPTIVHFDVAADDTNRAKKFYERLFDWKMENPPGMTDYYLIETKDLKGERGVGGGLGKRGDPAPLPMKIASKSSSNRSWMVIVLPTITSTSNLTPRRFIYSISLSTIFFGRRNSGIP